jgi:hypothetical protein
MSTQSNGTWYAAAGRGLLFSLVFVVVACAAPMPDSAPQPQGAPPPPPPSTGLAPGSGERGSGGGEPVGAQQNGYFEARVFFGTDRAHDSSAPFGFGTARGGGKIDYGEARVSIPDSHEVGELEAPAWWKLWDRENPTQYVVLLDTSSFVNQDAYASSVRALLGEAGRDGRAEQLVPVGRGVRRQAGVDV